MKRMRRGGVAQCVVVVLASLAAPAWAARKTEPFTTQVPTKPAVRDRHTLLLASFDRGDSNDAQYARHDARATTHGTKMDVPGKFGRGVLLSGPPMDYAVRKACYVLYDGTSNFLPARGTATFWIKSTEHTNIWSDDRTYVILSLLVRPDVFFEKHVGKSLVLKKTGKGKGSQLTLVWTTPPPRKYPDKPLFGISVSHLSPKVWHHVFLSWDSDDGGSIWLAADGKGVRYNFDPRLKSGYRKPGFQIHVGGASDRGDALDYTLDDLVIREQSLRSSARITKRRSKKADKIDTKALARCEDSARRFLEFLLEQGHKGTWYCTYSWPTLIPLNTRPYRISWQMPRDSVFMSKGYGSPAIAGQFMRAYRAMGDRRYLDACRRAGDFLIGVQKWNGGGFTYENVELQPGGAYAAKGFWVSADTIGIQENCQLDPAVFLAQLYIETGEKRYLDAFRWSCDTVLQAQNKSGSWPGFYKTKTKKPGWGPPAWLNDGTMIAGFAHMMVGYQMLKDQKYYDAAIRAADWLVRAQIETPIGAGWAQQYNAKDEPAWGRGFEPPAIVSRESNHAAILLCMAYDVTGDAKYLDSARKWTRFLDNCEAYAGLMYYDPKTGRPVTAWNGKIYFKEDIGKAPPNVRNNLMRQYGVKEILAGKKNVSADKFRNRWLKPRERGPAVPGPAKLDNFVTAALTSLASKNVQNALKTQDKSGAWIGDSRTGKVVNAQPREFGWYLLGAIRYARIALGELSPGTIHRWWRWWPDVDPSLDYQDTPALKAKGWTRDKKTKQLLPPPKILKGALGR